MVLPSNNINLNLYRVFYVVAMTKSFSESAKFLHISQPAISKHIQNLEFELDTVLFYRNNRGIDLTPEAKILLNYVEKAYNIIQLGEQQLQECKKLGETKISIGTPSILSTYYLNKYLKRFLSSYPGVTIKILNNKNEELLSLLEQHTLDLLIIYGEDNIDNDYKKETILEDEYVFVYNESKLKLDEIKTIKELDKQNILLPSKETIERKRLDNLLSEKNITIKPIMELESSDTMLNAIKEGFGIGYMLKSIALKIPNFKIIELEEELPKEKIQLVYDEQSIITSTKEFINLLKENI